jgi:hypothetical protein
MRSFSPTGLPPDVARAECAERAAKAMVRARLDMDTIDVSAVDPGPLGHSYIGDSPSVLDDVAKLVDGGARAGVRLGNPVTGPLGAYWRIAAAVAPSGGTH